MSMSKKMYSASPVFKRQEDGKMGVERAVAPVIEKPAADKEIEDLVRTQMAERLELTQRHEKQYMEFSNKRPAQAPAEPTQGE